MTVDSSTSDASICDRLERLEARIDDLERETETLRETVATQRDRIEAQRSAIETLEEENARLENEISALETAAETLEDRTETLEDQVNALEDQANALEGETESLRSETTRVEAIADAALKKAGANKDRIAKLQSRELEKGAHLLAEHVDPDALGKRIEHLERFTKDDDVTYVRVPNADDPLARGDSIRLSHADLLPIQQLAQMDDDMLRSATNSLPSRLAAKLWRARADPAVGDDPWQQGCKDVREYVTAGDMKHWIRRQESGVSDTYAKKLVSRTIDAVLELSKNRLAIRRKTERKNGLPYTERRVLLKTDASIPGDTTESPDSPETVAVHG